jgi:acetyl-CoA acetyltransferase
LHPRGRENTILLLGESVSHSAARKEGSSIINDAWIVEAVRTPRGRGRPDGGLHDIHPQHLFAQCLTAAADRVGFEINEVFAAVPLKTIRDLGLDPQRVNVNGGAIALGHPIGATDAVLIGTLLDELERRDLAPGLVTICTGGGMGTATIIERV